MANSSSTAARQLGAELRRLREKAGMTQEQLGLAAGIPQSKIARYESGRSEPRVDTMLRLAAALGYTHFGIDFRRRPL